MKAWLDKHMGVVGVTIAVLVALLALAAVLWPSSEEPVARSYSTGVYMEQGGDKLVAASGGEIEVQSGGTLDVQSGASFNAGTIDVTAADVDALVLTAQAVITLTDGSVITPTGSYQVLASAGTVTVTVETAGFSSGEMVVLANRSNTTINIEDSGTAKLSAAAALTQYDTLSLLFDGTNWLEVSKSAN